MPSNEARRGICDRKRRTASGGSRRDANRVETMFAACEARGFAKRNKRNGKDAHRPAPRCAEGARNIFGSVAMRAYKSGAKRHSAWKAYVYWLKTHRPALNIFAHPRFFRCGPLVEGV